MSGTHIQHPAFGIRHPPRRIGVLLMLSIGSGGNLGAGTDYDTISLGYRFSWGHP